jgi:hypothetical protein
MGTLYTVLMPNTSQNFTVDSDIWKGVSFGAILDNDKTGILLASCNWTNGEPSWGSVPENWRLGLYNGSFDACKEVVRVEITNRGLKPPAQENPSVSFLRKYGLIIAIFSGIGITGAVVYAKVK